MTLFLTTCPVCLQVPALICSPGVETAQTLQGISAQVLQNQKDLPVAIAANQAAGAADVAAANKDNEAGVAAISGMCLPSCILTHKMQD